MESAVAANMICIGLVENKQAGKYPTVHLVTSLSEITKDYIDKF
jgi:hypothetical protein